MIIHGECFIFQVYTASLYHIYVALEAGMDANATHAHIEPIYFPEVQRVAGLEDDLTFLYGPDWQDKIPLLPAVKKYSDHLQEIAEQNPALLAAHAYVRYFGDVSGGQILKRVIGRMYNFPSDGKGIAFYDFSHIASIPDFKALFSARLEALELDEVTREGVVNEAREAFQYNLDILRAVDALIDQEEDRQVVETTESWQLLPKSLDTRQMAFLGLSLVGLLSIGFVRVCPWITKRVPEALWWYFYRKV